MFDSSTGFAAGGGRGFPGASVPLTDLKPGTPYVCCVAPFAAYADDAHGTERDHGSTRSRDATVTVRIPGHGRVALPRSFAEAFITAVPALDRGVFDTGEVHIHVPEDNVDNEQPVFATNCERIIGWRRVGSCPSKTTALPPPLVGSTDERRAVATANAGLTLCDLEAVPHAVVPRLVLRHVVGPFVMRLLCTVKQACLGVTALKAGPDFPLAAVPNVTELTLTQLPVAPLPPRTTTLVAGSAAGFGMGVAPPPPRAPVILNSACGLTKLELRGTYHASNFDGVPPIPTVRTVTLANLGTSPVSENEESKLFLQTVAALTPNATALGFRDGALDLATFFSDEAGTIWPLLTELDFGGTAPCAAVMATARPWKVLVMRWDMSRPFGARSDISMFPDGLIERAGTQSRILASSLESLCVRSLTEAWIPPELLLRFFPPQCKALKSLILPDCNIILAPSKSRDPIVSSFLARADALEEVRVRDFDFGNGVAFAQPVSFDTQVALLSASFAPSVQSVGSFIQNMQWTRADGNPQSWVSSSLPAQETIGDPEKDTRQPQVLLIPDEAV